MVKTAKTFKLTHVGGHFSHFTIVSDASELAKRHKYFGWHYALGIQRWGFDPTDRISLQDLGGIKSPSFLVPYIKAHKSIIFSFLHNSSESSEHSNIQTHQPLDHSSHFQKVFKDPQEFRSLVPASVYVSFHFKSLFISSDNLLGPSFSLLLIRNG